MFCKDENFLIIIKYMNYLFNILEESIVYWSFDFIVKRNLDIIND